MIEKMGVYETVLESVSGKGRIIHRLLAFASQDMFLNYELRKIFSSREEVVSESINNAISNLEQEVGDKVRDQAKKLMTRLVAGLNRAISLLNINLNSKLFPIVEQELIDFDDHMYGTPDLILEDLSAKKAVVVEWKTYATESSKVSDVDKAQVVAYSIMEARRLGIMGIKEVFKSIIGVDDISLIKKLKKALLDLQDSNQPHEWSTKMAELNKIVNDIRRGIANNLRVLPLIVSTSKSYPPHPFMYLYRQTNLLNTAKRIIKLYDTMKRVLIAADHLTLQITNVENLLACSEGLGRDEIKQLLHQNCRSQTGYLSFNYTPCDMLPCGVPRSQEKWPCKTRKGNFYCSFAGDNGPCTFYFGRDRKEDFESIMWKLRYDIFEKKEKGLISYKAINIIFRNPNIHTIMSQHSEHGSILEVDLLSNSSYIKRKNSVIFYIHVKRGAEDIGKVRFDILRLSDVELGRNEIIARRKIRQIEKIEGVIGSVKRSVAAFIITPDSTSPLFSINTFLMVGEADLENDELIYYLYSPSPALYHNFKIFTRYVEYLATHPSVDAKLLLLEAPANLTVMELRAVDVLHRYIYEIRNRSDLRMKYAIESGISENVLLKEANLLEEYAKYNKITEELWNIPLVEAFKRIFGEK